MQQPKEKFTNPEPERRIRHCYKDSDQIWKFVDDNSTLHPQPFTEAWKQQLAAHKLPYIILPRYFGCPFCQAKYTIHRTTSDNSTTGYIWQCADCQTVITVAPAPVIKTSYKDTDGVYKYCIDDTPLDPQPFTKQYRDQVTNQP